MDGKLEARKLGFLKMFGERKDGESCKPITPKMNAFANETHSLWGPVWGLFRLTPDTNELD